MNLAEIIGLAAGFLTTVAFVPQVAKVWRDRSAKELSLKTFVAFSTGVILWLVYGVMLGQFPMILWNPVTLALVGAIVAMKLKFGVAVAITISEERGVRYLHFASPWVQGAMRIARPYALELEYTRDLMLPLLLRPSPEWPRSVLQIGLGPASVTKFLYRSRPQVRITVVEILPQVVAAAFQYFKLPDDSDRIRIEIGDGHEFVGRSRARFDLIVVDGYDDKGRAGLLDTAPFYMNCRERLTARGMIAVNLLTRQRGVTASIERLQLAFDGRVLEIPKCEAGNAVAIAAAGEEIRESLDDLRASARALKAASGLDLLPTLGRIAAASSAQDAVIL